MRSQDSFVDALSDDRCAVRARLHGQRPFAPPTALSLALPAIHHSEPRL